VMAYGGDGTQLDVVHGMINQKVPLAVLPGGTANALADELGIPPTFEPALRTLLAEDSVVRSMDVGMAGEQAFLLRFGSGMVATFSEVVDRDMKDRFGVMAYILGGIRAMNEVTYARYALTIDGEKIETEGAACLISNGNAIGAMGIRLSKHIFIDDGKLDVFVLNNDLRTAVGIAGSLVQAEMGDLNLQHWQGQEIILEAEPEQSLYADGENEAFGHTPITVRCLPGALKILTPKPTDSQYMHDDNEG
ncbi:MAG: hypothetical protein KC496_08945, partial [Anaerolineae bacterium]|nr:hypothetical protein [Anaerolineae bacterium]